MRRGASRCVAVAAATLAFVVAARVEFDIAGGFAVPTQLAFVPLLFVAPADARAAARERGLGAARACRTCSAGRSSFARLWVAFGNGWFSLGPALVLIVAGAHDAGDAGPWVLLVALARPVRRAT